ncbi:S9 family peptidase [Bowmanella denitrificans]|uniref:S9 family peptidase n=1 Tax=Bowmanella denitrificans TaxID=366582 RepID=UPI000C9B405A|nr:prolyl oligopeptidase family serine peptidase [Bowmanella denitrificans]
MRILPGILLALGLMASVQAAQAQDDGYQTPIKIMADLVDAPQRPGVAISKDRQWLAFLERPGTQTLADLAQPEEKLAGLKINPTLFAPSRASGYQGIKLKRLDGSQEYQLDKLPAGKILDVSFSPDSQKLAFVLETEQGLSLWFYHLADRRLNQASQRLINASLRGKKYRWLADSSGVYTRLTVAKADERPQPSLTATKPVIQTTDGKKAAVRTYSDLLKSPYDEALFEFLTRSQLARVGLDGSIQMLGQPGMISEFDASPDGRFLLVTQLQKPFSYMVPYSRFPELVEVWDAQGKLVKQVAKLPSGETIPKGFDSVREGPRSVHWRSDTAATLVWAEALDGGDMSVDVPHHDALYSLAAPFDGKPAEMLRLERRYSGIQWGNQGLAIVSEWRFSDRMLRSWKFQPANPKADWVLFEERSYNDRYKDPGDFVYTQNQYGEWVIKVENASQVYLTGRGASPQGNIPFLDRFDFATNQKQRLWQSEAPYYEQVMLVLDDKVSQLLTLRESQTEQPNFFIRHLQKDSLTQFSHFPHPSPAFVGVTKERIQYQRADGVALNGTLYLPPGYDKSQGPLPVLMWAYPREFKDKDVASQVKDSPFEFVRVSYWGPMPHLAQGFAIFDDPTMAIVGEGEGEPNDSFRTQLVQSAEAAVKVLVDKGIADPQRIAIGGHSYGAFMVANLLAHSDLFKAGIARSGAYNRSLTPFGFQGEERSFWEAQDVYGTMSPFFHAEKINEPILMLHGEDDPNSGTYPMQSERMFAALKGLGGNARLVMLPHEQHGYRARESLLHMLWEQSQWLETHVKTAETE